MRLLTLAFLLGSVCPAFAADLVLKRVMLSSAGVGYFEYEADVDGTAALGLDVPLDEVDDVLTSLVVFDSAGGVGTMELPGRDNTRASFADLPFGPAALRSPIDTLNSLQGVVISVQGPRPMTGRIVHADLVTEPLPTTPGQPPATVQRTRVTLLGADGLQQFVLEDASSIQVANPTCAIASRGRWNRCAVKPARTRATLRCAAPAPATERYASAMSPRHRCGRRRIGWYCRRRMAIPRACKAGPCWRISPAPTGTA
jgi:hypothetical protein